MSFQTLQAILWINIITLITVMSFWLLALLYGLCYLQRKSNLNTVTSPPRSVLIPPRHSISSVGGLNLSVRDVVRRISTHSRLDQDDCVTIGNNGVKVSDNLHLIKSTQYQEQPLESDSDLESNAMINLEDGTTLTQSSI